MQRVPPSRRPTRPSDRPPTTLYARHGQPVAFARPGVDRLLRQSAIGACLAWDGRHTPLDLSTAATNWLSTAHGWAQRQAILLTPPPLLAMELHNFAEVWLAPRIGRAAQRSLIDGLTPSSFVRTWCLAYRQTLTKTAFDVRCFNWSLRQHAALLKADAFACLAREGPDAYRAWVACGLERMSAADAADWRDHEAAFVWVLREAEHLDLAQDEVALPEMAQVASDDLRIFRDWLLERPVWEAAKDITRTWTGGRQALGRQAYILRLLRQGVTADSFVSLVALLAPDAWRTNSGVYDLLPTYAARGNFQAMAWILARAPEARNPEANRQVRANACAAAIRADRDDVLQALFCAPQSRDTFALHHAHGNTLARCAAYHSAACTEAILAATRASDTFKSIDVLEVFKSAIAGRCLGAAQVMLNHLDAVERQELAATSAWRTLTGRAMNVGDAAMSELLLAQISCPERMQAVLLQQAPGVAWVLPWDSAALAENKAENGLSILKSIPARLPHVNDTVLAAAVASRWAHLAAALQDMEATQTLLHARPGAVWRRATVEAALAAWLEEGASVQSVQAILGALPSEERVQMLQQKCVSWTRKAIAGGRVGTLRWLGATLAPSQAERSRLLHEAFEGGRALLQAPERGHVDMLRFWLQEHEKGAYADAVIAYGKHAIIEHAAQANQPAVLDLVVLHLTASGELDRVMAAVGANAFCFAVQGKRREVLHKLMALPLCDATRWNIAAGVSEGSDGNSPVDWAARVCDIDILAELLAWAPEGYRVLDRDLGMAHTVIEACRREYLPMARFALGCGSDKAKRSMLKLHHGRLVALAAEHGDVQLLEQARHLQPREPNATSESN